ncbi:MAG: hypothetical protein ACPGRX_04370 [Bdellovibrionales bacterium]
MEKLQRSLNIAVLAAETSHVFCCVLPTVFSLLSLLAGFGLIGAMPSGMLQFHDAMHEWEVPIIIASGVVIVLGWALHDYARRIDCHDTGCGHGPCEPKKKRSAKVLKIASVLFLVNVSVYVLVHRGLDIGPSSGLVVQEAAHHDHDHAH